MDKSVVDNVPKRMVSQSIRATRTVALVLTIILLPLLFGAEVRAVHTLGLLELDGNIADDPGDGPDWGSIFNGAGGVGNLFGCITATFITDDVSTASAVDRTTYSGAGGSNKNNDPIFIAGEDTWHWDTGDVPAKDDFLRGYAYACLNTANSRLIVYSGFERRVSTGDSHIDIELFQAPVGLQEVNSITGKCSPTGIDKHSGCHFFGTRTVNDVIISMDFTLGGSLGSISVRRWQGTTYGAPISTLVNPTAANPCTPDDLVCGLNNPSPISGIPWAPGATLGVNQFTEFGIDVTGLLQGVTPCISTVLGKTRSSQSFTAELKDFAGPSQFNVCPSKLGEIHGVKFLDKNGNHARDLPDDVGLADWTITLTGTDTVTNTPVSLSTTTCGGTVSCPMGEPVGSYWFTGLTAGTYTACETLQTGWIQTFPTSGASCSGSTLGYSIPITTGTVSTGNDFGNFRTLPCIVCLTKFVGINTPTYLGVPGLIAGNIVYIMEFLNNGSATVLLSGSLTVTTDATQGTVSVVSGTPTWTDISVSPGKEVAFTVGVDYFGLNSGATIQAVLVASFTIPPGGILLTVPGTPATMIFTV